MSNFHHVVGFPRSHHIFAIFGSLDYTFPIKIIHPKVGISSQYGYLHNSFGLGKRNLWSRLVNSVSVNSDNKASSSSTMGTGSGLLLAPPSISCNSGSCIGEACLFSRARVLNLAACEIHIHVEAHQIK